jgi:hypothetical protein
MPANLSSLTRRSVPAASAAAGAASPQPRPFSEDVRAGLRSLRKST